MQNGKVTIIPWRNLAELESSFPVKIHLPIQNEQAPEGFSLTRAVHGGHSRLPGE